MNTDSPSAPTLEASPLAAALCRAQTDVKAALKTSTNTFHGYAYASAETIVIVAREALNTNGLTLSVTNSHFVPFADGAGVGGAVGMLDSTFTLEHRDGASRELRSDTPVYPEQSKLGGWSRPLDKAVFAAMTEALGYMLRGLLLIPRSDAPDASGRTDAAEGAGAAASAPRRRAAGAAAAAVAPVAAPVASAISPAAVAVETTAPAIVAPLVPLDDFKTVGVSGIVDLLERARAAGQGAGAEVEFTARAQQLLKVTPMPLGWGPVIASAKLTNGDCSSLLRTAYAAAIARVKGSAPTVAT